jgi:hypothetical protein
MSLASKFRCTYCWIVFNPLKDIRDEMLKEIKYEAENERDAASLKTFFLKSYANIALANLKLNQFQEAENACNEILHIDPFNTKGLYLRSQTRLRPKSSSSEEKEKGCKDLWLANKYNPQNSFIRLVMRSTDISFVFCLF